MTGLIIGAAIEVHRVLGPGFLESVYEEALVVEMGVRRIPCVRQQRVDIRYRGRTVGRHRLDLLVADEVVVELKAIETLAPVHQGILLSYLRATNLRLGLLLNFGTPRLQIKRMSNG